MEHQKNIRYDGSSDSYTNQRMLQHVLPLQSLHPRCLEQRSIYPHQNCTLYSNHHWHIPPYHQGHRSYLIQNHSRKLNIHGKHNIQHSGMDVLQQHKRYIDNHLQLGLFYYYNTHLERQHSVDSGCLHTVSAHYHQHPRVQR